MGKKPHREQEMHIRRHQQRQKRVDAQKPKKKAAIKARRSTGEKELARSDRNSMNSMDNRIRNRQRGESNSEKKKDSAKIQELAQKERNVKIGKPTYAKGERK